MYSFHVKVNENGRIIIPATIRKELNIKGGEEVIISKTEDDEIRIVSIKQSIKKIQDILSKKKLNLTEQLFYMRKEEVL